MYVVRIPRSLLQLWIPEDVTHSTLFHLQSAFGNLQSIMRH